MPLNPNWSDSEGEEEDWIGDREKEKEIKELELKNNNIIEPESPHYQSTSITDRDDTVLAPKLTDTLVPTTEEEQKEDDTENNSENDSKTYYDLNDTLDNIM